MASSSHQNNPPHEEDNNDDNNDDNNNNPSENYPPEKDESKKGKGRRKVRMERIENETSRQISFSKRRTGLFKKASELNTLCGAQTGALAFSPSGKAHSFGSPSVEAIIHRFLNQINLGDRPASAPPLQDHVRLQNNVNELQAQLEALKKSNNIMRRSLPNLNELDFENLGKLKKSIKEVKKELNLPSNMNPENPNPGAEGGGLGSGFSMFNPNMQGSGYMGTPFSGEPTGYLSDPGSLFLPDMFSANHGFVDPYDPSGGEGFMVPFPFSSTTSGPNVVSGQDLFRYGNPGQDVMQEDGATGASMWAQGESSRRRRQRKRNSEDKSNGATKDNNDRGSEE